MARKLCKILKKVKNPDKEYIKLTDDVKYVCKKCGLKANNEKNLCSAKKIK